MSTKATGGVQQSAAHASDAAAELAEIQRLAHVGSWSHDLVTDVRRWSAELLRIYGMPADAAPPTREAQAALMDPDEYAEMSRLCDRAADMGEVGEIEYWIRRPDGTVRRVVGRIEAVWSTTGAITATRGTIADVTELVAARTAHAASEARYRLLAENAGDVVANVNNKGLLDWISPSVTDVLGWTPDELIGTPALKLAHQTSRRAVIAARRSSLAGEVTRFEGQIRTRSGTYRWVDVSTRPIAGEDGTVTGRVSTWRVIDAEVAAREQVLEGKRLLEAVFESTSDAVFAKDADGRYIVCNHVTAALVGKTAAEMFGVTDADLLPAAEAALIRQDEVRIMTTGEPETIDARLTLADGRQHWTTSTKAPLRNTAGTVIGIVGVTRDTTERREAEARYQSTLDRMLEGCMLIDRAWRYLYLNDVAAAHGHTTRAAALGRTMLEMHPSIEQTEVFARFRRCMDTREPQRFEASYSLADGAADWFSFSVEPVPEGIFVLSVDITKQRQASEALRDGELRLAEALRLEAIGRLAGGVAHDFNNLLMAINGTAELLAAETPDDDPRRADVDAISEAGRRAAALTSQLLAFGRRQVLRPTVVSLDEVLAEATPLLRRTLGEDIELVVEASPDAAPVRVDRSQLEQVLVNLVFNARDAMPDGGALILAITPTIADEATASLHHGVRPGRFIRLSVSDTGIGIPDDIAGRIFEPFFTTKGLGRGTGLGLATVQGIVAQSGGWIEVDSQVGHGTTFHVHLPVAAEPATPAAETPAITVLGGSETILVVEDEDQVRHVAVRMLRELGYAVTHLSGPYPALALDAGALAAVDLLLTDVVMPGLNGLRLDSLLRERSPRLRTIFMSGFAPDGAVRERLQVAGTGFLDKPFSRADLALTVRTILDTPLAGIATPPR